MGEGGGGQKNPGRPGYFFHHSDADHFFTSVSSKRGHSISLAIASQYQFSYRYQQCYYYSDNRLVQISNVTIILIIT